MGYRLNWGKMMKMKICADEAGGGGRASEPSKNKRVCVRVCVCMCVCVSEYVQNPNEAMSIRTSRSPPGAPHRARARIIPAQL